jgi:hypothetical protein
MVLPETTIHLLGGVEEPVSATKIRAAAASGKKLDSLVGAAVAEYIRKEGLYKKGAQVLPDQKEQRAREKQEREAQKHRAGLHIIGGRRHSQQ